MRKPAFLAVLFIPVLLITSCFYGSDLFGVSNTRYSAEEDFSYSIDVTSQAGFLLQGINGTVELAGDPDATTVEVWGTRRVKSESVADARQNLEDLLVLVATTADRVTVRTDQPEDTHGRSFIVNYHIVVPEALDVRVVHVNGEIEILSLTGDLDVISTNGEARIDSVFGDTVVNLTNGNLRLWEMFGDVESNLSNGNVTARVNMQGTTDCDLGVTNGQIDLSVPFTSSAQFSAAVTNGSITLGSGFTLADIQSTPTSLSGRLGTGLGTIRLRTTNGTIEMTGF
ncbi:DUF4097 family beta strand repeat-containing protein [Candidatus Zixiibacteriota bacterium]